MLRSISFIFCCFTFIVSCDSPPSEVKDNAVVTDSTHHTNDIQAEELSNADSEEGEESVQNITVNLAPGTYEGIYEGATFYTGSTDFAFKIDGELQLIRIMNDVYLDIEEGKEVAGYDLPTDLLENSEELEGPPAGNPKWIGKRFKLLRTENSFSIIPIKE